MERKMFGIKGKLGTAKLKVFKVCRLISGLGLEDSNVASPTGYSLAHRETKTFNLQAHALAKQRLNEIEGEKAMSLFLLRHERWKAGGPV